MNNEELIPVSFKGKRVLTTEQLAQVYETTTDNIKHNFNRNTERFKEGKHYYLLKGSKLKTFKNQVTDSPLVNPHTSQLYLWTERGADRHCKILDTDRAWDQFDNLEETYFKVKEELAKPKYKLPTTFVEALRMLADKVEQNEQLASENKELKSDKAELNEKVKILIGDKTELNNKNTFKKIVGALYYSLNGSMGKGRGFFYNEV